MKKSSILLFFILSCITILNAAEASESHIDHLLTDYEIYDIPTKEIYLQLKSERKASFEIQIEDNVHTIRIYQNNLIADHYVSNVKNPNRAIPTTGTIDAQGLVSLTIADGFIYGFLTLGEKEWSILPLSYFGDTTSNKFIGYFEEDVIEKPTGKCGTNHTHHLKELKMDAPQAEQAVMMGCKLTEIAIASDFSMFQNYGSVTSVENRNIGALNNVQNNYLGVFSDDIEYSLVEQFVSNCSTCDPWTSSAIAGDLLNSFRTWAPTGFTNTHDIGGLWTRRDLDDPMTGNGVIGLAWVGAVCSPFRYHILEDFSSVAGFIRVLWAHEIGHNFDCTHDAQGSATIMAPTVSTTNNWSSLSTSEVNAFLPTLGCLSNCPGNTPPIADFTANMMDICVGDMVVFDDLSQNSPSSWSWSFPGGTPASSTLQNPTVTYNTPGTYDVELTVTSAAGSDTETKTAFITVGPLPTAGYTFTVSNRTVNFTSNSQNASTYLWDFGDGNTSTDPSPTHTYSSDGLFDVLLQVGNDCGSDFIQQQVGISASPVAQISSDIVEGCAPQVIQFDASLSLNVATVSWEFEGGNPATSSSLQPNVTYENSGEFDVKLTITNPFGSDEMILSDHITIDSVPSVDFDFVADNLMVTFSSNIGNANGITWDFGDGNQSSDPNPTHTYATDGTYQVELTATNNCGSSVKTLDLEVFSKPVARFNFDVSEICIGDSIQFDGSQSSNADSFIWSFPGGSPASSSLESPTVSYPATGVYDVELQVFSTETGQGDTTRFFDIIDVEAPPLINTVNLDIQQSRVDFDFDVDRVEQISIDFGNGSDTTLFTTQNFSFIYMEDGVYDIVVTAINRCGQVSESYQVDIVSPVIANFDYNQLNDCAPVVVEYINQSSTNTSMIQWSLDGADSIIYNGDTAIAFYENRGVFDAELQVQNALYSDVMVLNDIIEVLDRPIANFSLSSDSLTIRTTNTSMYADSFEWHFGDGSTSFVNNPIHTYSVADTFNVQLVAFNQCGPDTFLEQVIAGAPIAAISSSLVKGCAPLRVLFTSNSSGNIDRLDWTFEGGSPAAANTDSVVVEFNQAGNYQVELTVSNAAGSNSETMTIEVLPAVSSEFDFQINQSQLEVQFFIVDTTGIDSVSWLFGDGNASADFSPIHIYPDTGSYIAQLLTYNTCSSDTVEKLVVIDHPSSAQDRYYSNVEIYPNPASQFIKIDGINNSDRLKLVDLTGKVHYDGVAMNQILLDEMPPGSYILQLSNIKGARLNKLIIIVR